MALRAGKRCMIARQREGRVVVGRRVPGGRAVAVRAVLREGQRNVIRRTLVIRLMARDAIRGQLREGAVGVALHTGQAIVTAGQREG